MKLIDIDALSLQSKLQHYLEQDSNYKAVFEYTKQRFENAHELPAHNWAHAYRDTLNAIVVGEEENADMTVVLPAITMHDIGFLYGADGRTHGKMGADELANYLQDGGIAYSQEMIDKIASCIRTHKGSRETRKPRSKSCGRCRLNRKIRTNWCLSKYSYFYRI